MRKALLLPALLLAAGIGAWQLSRARTVQLFGEIVPRVETERKVVALTFDDGPDAAVADELLAALRRADAKATFFLIGGAMAEQPGVAGRLVAAGHELGNHSYSHRRMVLKSPSFIRAEFERTDALIRAAGQRGPIHVRAPYGKKLVGLPWYFARHRRVHVTWDVAPDSEPGAGADQIAADVLANARPGSIILLHPWYPGRAGTRAALPKILEGLKARGFAFVTVNELLNMRRA